MDWNDFFQSVRDGRFQSVYLFSGPEAYTKREALAALRRAVLPAGLEQLNDVTLEGCSAQDIIDSAETLPVMCERRIVVVRDWAPLVSGNAKNGESDTERMQKWLKDAPDSCILVFYMTVELDGRKKLAAALKKLDGYVEFSHLSGVTLTKWCNQQLKPLGKKLRPDAMNELSLMAGQDLTQLLGELKKLAAYVGDAPEIAAEDVRAIVTPSPEYTTFMILDRLLEGRLDEATSVVNTVLQTEMNPVRLLGMLTNQLRIDVHVKYARASGNEPAVLASLKVNEYRARHIRRQIAPLSAEALQSCYLSCVEADFAIKSGKLKDRAALDALMLKIATICGATKSKSAPSKS